MGKLIETSKPPGYYIRKRLNKNKPAIFGLFIIISALIISLLGYLIMPDSTPDANDGAVQIQKQPPGSEVTFLKIRKNRKIEKVNLFHKAIYGQESEYMIVPIKEYEINNLTVKVSVFGKSNYIKEYKLLDVVKSTSHNNFQIMYNVAGEKIIKYKTIAGVEETIPYNELVDEFYANNIENRKYWLGTDKMGRDMLSRL
ncbi:MAG: ABC transporter permease, partial [Cyclobacteriaceae bacterium]|nr:ABC transporter permease [Cyclobacteriaceae bacterium]